MTPTGPRRPDKTFEEELADIRAANKDLREAQGLLWDDSLREAREREAERLKVIADALKAEEAARAKTRRGCCTCRRVRSCGQ